MCATWIEKVHELVMNERFRTIFMWKQKGRDLDVNYKESRNWRGRPLRNTCRELSDLFKDSERCLCVLSLQDITFPGLSAIAAKGGFRSSSYIFLSSPARVDGEVSDLPQRPIIRTGEEGKT